MAPPSWSCGPGSPVGCPVTLMFSLLCCEQIGQIQHLIFIVGNTFSKEIISIQFVLDRFGRKQQKQGDDILCQGIIVGIPVIIVFVGGKTSSGGEKFMADWTFNVTLLLKTVVKLLEVNELHRTGL